MDVYEKLKINPYVNCSDNVLVEMKRDREIMQVVSTGDPNVFTIRKGCNRESEKERTLSFQSVCSEVFDYHINFFQMNTNLMFPKGMDTVLAVCKDVFQTEVDKDGTIAERIKKEYEEEKSKEDV